MMVALAGTIIGLACAAVIIYALDRANRAAARRVDQLMKYGIGKTKIRRTKEEA
jgi:ABC-type lipoprotein release transport system permease subunit